MEKTGIVARYLASIESEQKNPNVDTLYRLIRAYGVSADRIFYPELAEGDSTPELIHRLGAVCSPAQQRIILDLIRMLQKHQYGLS